MKKKPKKSVASTKMTQEELDLIEKAAAVRVWSKATLIRIAAIEYAKSVLTGAGS